MPSQIVQSTVQVDIPSKVIDDKVEIAEESSKDSDAEDTKATVADAEEHFAKGKRHLYVNDASAAVNSLQEASRLYAELYGETGHECAEVYFYYGKALLELARIESDVLGNALDGVPEGPDHENSQIEDPEKLTEEEKDHVTEIVGEAIEENFVENEKLQHNSASNEIEISEEDEKMDTEMTNGTDEVEKETTKSEVKVPSPKKDEAEKEVSLEKNKADEEESTKKNDTDEVESLKEESLKKDDSGKEESLEKDEADKKKSLKSDESDEVKSLKKNEADEEETSKKDEADNKKSLKTDETDKEVESVKAVTEDEDKEEKIENGKEISETPKVNGLTESSDSEMKEVDENNDIENNGDAEEEEQSPDEEAEGEEVESKEPEGDQTEEDDDVGNLQLAWEMLELSKVICLKQETQDDNMKLKISEIHLKLGEVGLESENYPQSLEDFSSCLDLQKQLLKEDDRRLAETHYEMGVAYSFSEEFDKAISSFTQAGKVIETKLANMKSQLESLADKAEKEQEVSQINAEIEELEKLLPEIKEKLLDMNQMKKDSKDKLQKLKETAFAGILGGSRETGECSTSGFGSSTTEPSSTLSAKPISNISHLVKKKRKTDEELITSDAKKAKGINGEAVSNGNGSIEKMEDEESVTQTIAETSA